MRMTSPLFLPSLLHGIRSAWLSITFGIVFFIWTFTCLLAPINSGVDASWKLGLNWALSRNWQWGQQVMFTYGPLFWLHSNLIPAFYPLASVLIGLFLFNVCAAICAGYLFSRFVPKSWDIRQIVFQFFIAYSLLLWNTRYATIELFLCFTLVLFAEYWQKQRSAPPTKANRIPLLLIPLLLVVSQYIKFSYFILAISLLFIMAIGLFSIHRKMDVLLLLLGYAMLSLVIWWGIGQSIANLPQYLSWGLLISGGYTEAMQSDFYSPAIYQAWIFVFCLFFLYFIYILRSLFRKEYSIAFAWMIPLPVLFLLFKEGFIRADGHAHIVFMSLPFLIIYFLYVSRQRWPIEHTSEPHGVTYSLLGVLIIILLASHSLFNPSFLPSSQFSDIKSIVKSDPSSEPSMREILSEKYKLESEVLVKIQPTEPIDIFPNDIALLYAYNLKWSPRPMIQSYTAYSPALDLANAGHFLEAGAPTQILWSSESIDTKYTPFDEPRTFRALLDRYRFIAVETTNRYALLRLNPQRAERELIPLGEIESHILFEPILIPRKDNSHIYMNIFITPNPAGWLLNIFYKAPYFTLNIKTLTGQSYQYRFIRELGPDGFFVSKYISNASDLQSVIGETYIQDIESIRFIGSSWFYSRSIAVQFFYVPFAGKE